MKKIELALCDLDYDYITAFASYIFAHYDNVNINIFTTLESYYADEGVYDVGIMSSEFEEVSLFKNSGEIQKKYYLYEEKAEEEFENHIYKYQALDKILSGIKEINSSHSIRSVSTNNSNGKSKFIGIYSPVSHELQLPFSMALSDSYRDKGSVLFLDLEEISVMPDLIASEKEKNIMDLIYEISTEDERVNLDEYIYHFRGVDYIEPFYNPNELGEIDMNTWKRLMGKIEKIKYDYVVVLFGRAINGFAEIVDTFDQLYILGKPGDYFKRGQEVFCNYLERANSSVNAESVILPMSAGNLCEGAYCIEELLQGNLGVFVKKLINNKDELKVSCCG